MDQTEAPTAEISFDALQASRPPVLLVGGATASGKSALALALAQAWRAEILNADSMQVYADLAILTARPTPREMAAAPHHLFGVVDAAETYSVGRWLAAARQTLDEIAARGRTAIVVGGTGLYFRALLQGLAEVPPIPPQVRASVRADWDEMGEASFRERLREIDPAAEARIERGDRQRLCRALEVALSTSRPLSEWQAQTSSGIDAGRWREVVIEPPRPELYARCDERLSQMLDGGALAEVERLLARQLDPRVPAMKALGVAALAGVVRGEIDRAEALAQAQAQTRRYAKRSLTWFRNQAPDWPRLRQS